MKKFKEVYKNILEKTKMLEAAEGIEGYPPGFNTGTGTKRTADGDSFGAFRVGEGNTISRINAFINKYLQGSYLAGDYKFALRELKVRLNHIGLDFNTERDLMVGENRIPVKLYGNTFGTTPTTDLMKGFDRGEDLPSLTLIINYTHDSNTEMCYMSGKISVERPLNEEESKKLQELAFLAPLAGMAVRAAGSALVRKAAGTVARNVAGNAISGMMNGGSQSSATQQPTASGTTEPTHDQEAVSVGEYGTKPRNKRVKAIKELYLKKKVNENILRSAGSRVLSSVSRGLIGAASQVNPQSSTASALKTGALRVAATATKLGNPNQPVTRSSMASTIGSKPGISGRIGQLVGQRIELARRGYHSGVQRAQQGISNPLPPIRHTPTSPTTVPPRSQKTTAERRPFLPTDVVSMGGTSQLNELAPLIPIIAGAALRAAPIVARVAPTALRIGGAGGRIGAGAARFGTGFGAASRVGSILNKVRGGASRFYKNPIGQQIVHGAAFGLGASLTSGGDEAAATLQPPSPKDPLNDPVSIGGQSHLGRFGNYSKPAVGSRPPRRKIAEEKDQKPVKSDTKKDEPRVVMHFIMRNKDVKNKILMPIYNNLKELRKKKKFNKDTAMKHLYYVVNYGIRKLNSSGQKVSLSQQEKARVVNDLLRNFEKTVE